MRGQSLYDYCMEHEDKKYLLDEWDYEKNEKELGLSPKDVARANSRIKVWWKCNNEHSYDATVSHRIVDNTGCPYCRNKKVLKGYNDLATTHPNLVLEWDYEKNEKELNCFPDTVITLGGKKVHWVCKECGHKWSALINNRKRGQGCPKCDKEKHSSFSEQAIYYYLKQVYKEVLNGSTDLLDGKLELDIYIPEIKTAIEYDGVAWHKEVEKDLQKNELCNNRGIRLIRIREQGLSNIVGSYNLIRKDKNTDNGLEKVLKELFSLLSIKVDVNIERDRQNIYSQYVRGKKENSLAVKFPEIAKDWHPTKNENLTPENVSWGSEKKVWWQCDNGHEYQMTVSTRTVKSNSCYYCSGHRVLRGFNDLVTTNPEIACEWHPTKNGTLTPYDVIKGSHKSVWWQCDKGHEWSATIAHRVYSKTNCPYCSNHKLLPGYNDLYTVYPDVAKEWHPTKNGILKPNQVAWGYNKKVWWLCSVCGHEWFAIVNNRTSHKRGCPECGKKKVVTNRNSENNVLASNYPDLLIDWDYDKNDVLPSEISSGSHKEIHWKCSVCGHEYVRVAREQVKIKGIHCPECAKNKRNK